jgi:putative hemolysin
MSSVWLEVLFILLLIFANGLFAMSEIAVISARKIRLQQWVNEGNLRARTALDLANAPNQFLSTVQVGITLIGILAGAFGGARLGANLAPILGQVPGLAPYSAALSLGIVVLSITYLSLVIGELVPKRIALSDPERIATAIARPMRGLSKITAPVVHLLSLSTETLLRLLKIPPMSEPLATEEDIKVLLQQGTEAGTFEATETDIVQRVFRLGDRRINSLMTPRLEITWLNLENSLEKNRQTMLNSIHSRFPVCQGSLDHSVGIIHVKDLLTASLQGQPLDLMAALHQPLFVPESMRALNVLELFKRSDTPHTALVVDEYGVIQGLVTLTDILEAIVGDMPTAEERAEPAIIEREDGSWLLDGMLPVEDLFDLLQIRGQRPLLSGNYHTLGGFVVHHLGRIPISSDYFDWQGFRFEVVDMDGNRVDKVLVVVPPASNASGPL